MAKEPEYPNQDCPFAGGWQLRTTPTVVALNRRYEATCGVIDSQTLLAAGEATPHFGRRWLHGLHGRREPFAGFTFDLENGKVGVEFPRFLYDGGATMGIEGEVVVCTSGDVPEALLDEILAHLIGGIPDMAPPSEFVGADILGCS